MGPNLKAKKLLIFFIDSLALERGYLYSSSTFRVSPVQLWSIIPEFLAMSVLLAIA